jgi:hypothetical protein
MKKNVTAVTKHLKANQANASFESSVRWSSDEDQTSSQASESSSEMNNSQHEKLSPLA